MSKTVTIALANGDKATIDSLDDRIAYQVFDPSGQAVGPGIFAALSFHSPPSDPFGGARTVEGDSFVAVALPNGGFEIAYYDLDDNGALGQAQELQLRFVDTTGHFPADYPFLVGDVLPLEPSAATPSGVTLPAPELHALDGDRVALAYTAFPGAPGQAVEHLALANTHGGVYFNTAIAALPDQISHANGDITLTWHEGGQTIREVFGEDGAVLAARGVSQGVTLGVASGANLAGFSAAHDQLTLVNADGTVAAGARSTLTFDAVSHTLTWDPDSQGPATATTVASLPGVDRLTVANLSDSFRPEVLKNLAADGSSTIQWFDSDHSQTWDTLFATFDTQGRLTTYASTLDDGTRTVFNFDADNSQPYTRYVDQDDAAGHVLVRSVLYDDGQSWTAHFNRDGSYELDSFDALGHQVGKGFFTADGTPTSDPFII